MLWEIQYLLGRLESKREFVALALAGYRNRMVRMNVHLGIFGLSLAVGTTLSGFFGMNLVSGLEESPMMFYYVVGAAATGGGMLSLYAMNYMSGTTMHRRAEVRIREIETL
jgi:magnesium transporter